MRQKILKFDSNLKEFFEFGMSGLVRENIQNSLDAKLNEDKPVHVKIETGIIGAKSIPGLNSVLKNINNLSSENEYDKK